MGKVPHLCIDYMPWANLNEEFSIGPVTFWPFYAKAEEKIPDKQVREYLRRFFKCFVDCHGKPVESIVICSQGNIDFRQLSEEETKIVRSAVDCLIFAKICGGTRNGVCANNRYMAPPTADRFTLYGRNFNAKEDGLGIRAGSSLSYFSNMEEVQVSRPFAMGGSSGHVNGSLLKGFGKLLTGEGAVDLKERIFRCLEWFRLAHTEADAVSWLSKVVMMATAFEILLSFPSSAREKKKFFADYIDQKCRQSNSINEIRKDKKGGEHTASLTAWWACDFYNLRSKIVHGNPIKPKEQQYKDWITQLIIADLMLLELIQRILYERRCIGDELRERAEEFAKDCSAPIEVVENELLPGLFGFDFDNVHKALGWITPTSKAD